MTVVAKAIMMIEVQCSARWSDDSVVSEVKSQDVDDAVDKVNKMCADSDVQAKVLGKPTISLMTFDDPEE